MPQPKYDNNQKSFCNFCFFLTIGFLQRISLRLSTGRNSAWSRSLQQTSRYCDDGRLASPCKESTSKLHAQHWAPNWGLGLSVWDARPCGSGCGLLVQGSRDAARRKKKMNSSEKLQSRFMEICLTDLCGDSAFHIHPPSDNAAPRNPNALSLQPLSFGPF